VRVGLLFVGAILVGAAAFWVTRALLASPSDYFERSPLAAAALVVIGSGIAAILVIGIGYSKGYDDAGFSRIRDEVMKPDN
jgi:hypothetical protein